MRWILLLFVFSIAACGGGGASSSGVDTVADTTAEDWYEREDAAPDVAADTAADTAQDSPCVPDCAGKQCGDDGCGSVCGACMGLQEACEDGQCVCQPDCSGGVECGDDGCGGSCWTSNGPECDGTGICIEGACVCQPDCDGKVCGEDGCGGFCGECAEGESCVAGACVTCEADEDCDDGNVCTEDSCEDGECEFFPVGGDCDDGDACTTEDSCVNGECAGGPDLVCDDLDDCTEDSCLPESGCTTSPLSDVDCNDGAGGCVEGECVPKEPVCDDGWVLGELTTGTFCYRPFIKDVDEKKTWYGAQQLCEGFDANLVSIHSEEEQAFVELVINKKNIQNDTTWTGANDLSIEGTFVWTDETPFDFEHWELGHPNNWAGCTFGSCPENCVAVNDPLIGFGGWNDLDCDNTYRYICKKPAGWVVP